ncbi:hypothetical protein [Arthrobacter sp. D2-10]
MKLIHRASRRAGSRRSLLAILALTLALLTAVLAGIIGYAQLAATEALRSLATAPGPQGYFRVSTTVADDAGAQLADAESIFAELGLTDGLQVSTASFSAPLPLVPSGGSATNLPADLTFQPVGWAPTTTPVAGFVENLTPDGAPGSRSGPVPAAMPALAADSLGLVPGDTFAVEGAQGTVRLELVATLNPSGPDAAFLDPAPAEGVETAPTTVIVPPSSMGAFSADPALQWALTADQDSASATALPRLADALRELPERLTEDPAFEGDVEVSGELVALLDSTTKANESVRAVLMIALAAVAVAGVLTLALFARRVAPSRRVLLSAGGSCVLGWGAAVVQVPLLFDGGASYLARAGNVAGASWAVPLLCVAGAVVVRWVASVLRKLPKSVTVPRFLHRHSSAVIPMVLVAVTIGMATFAAAYSEALHRTQAAASQLVNGSDVRVELPDVPASELPPLESFDGELVRAQSWAYRGDVQVASETAQLVAVDAESLPSLLGAGADLIDVDELAGALAYQLPVPEPALTLLPSATQVRLQFSSVGTTQPATDDDASARAASVTAWIRTENRALVSVPAGTLALAGTSAQAHSLSFSLPEGSRPVAVAALDIALEAAENPAGYDLKLTGVSSDGGIGNGQSRLAEESTLRLAPEAFGAGRSEIAPLDDGVGVRFPAGPSAGDTVRARLVAEVFDERLPVALSSSLLAKLGLSVGDPIPLSAGEVDLPAVLAAVTPIIPGTSEAAAVLVNWQAYSAASLATLPTPSAAGEIWLATTDLDDAKESAQASAGAGTVVTASDSRMTARFLDPAVAVLWVAVVGNLLLGGVGIGLSARAPAQPRLSQVAGVGIVLGFASGLAIAALAVPVLVQSAVVDAAEGLRVPLLIAVMPLLTLAAIQVLLLVLIGRFCRPRVTPSEAYNPTDAAFGTGDLDQSAVDKQETTMIEVPAEYTARHRGNDES